MQSPSNEVQAPETLPTSSVIATTQMPFESGLPYLDQINMQLQWQLLQARREIESHLGLWNNSW